MTKELAPPLQNSLTVKERLSSILSNLLLRAEDFVFGKVITTYRVDEELRSQMSAYTDRYGNHWTIVPVIKTERRKRAAVAVESFCYLAECFAFDLTSGNPVRRHTADCLNQELTLGESGYRRSEYFGDYLYHRVEFKNFTDAVREIHRYLEGNSDLKDLF